MKVLDKLNKRIEQADSLLCVGLDPDFEKLPREFQSKPNPLFAFNKSIIDQTHEYVSTFKMNVAFYEAHGHETLADLKLTIDYLNQNHPNIFSICDTKRGDIGNTNKAYAEAYYDYFGFDAITLHPYMGAESLKEFLGRQDKVCIILCRTSNPGAGEFQDLEVEDMPLWQYITRRVATKWNENNNCMIVVGAPYVEELKQARQIIGDMTMLVPGVGKQGGNAEEVVKAGLNSEGAGLIINSSRGIIFSDDPAKAAKELRDEINKYRK